MELESEMILTHKWTEDPQESTLMQFCNRLKSTFHFFLTDIFAKDLEAFAR